VEVECCLVLESGERLLIKLPDDHLGRKCGVPFNNHDVRPPRLGIESLVDHVAKHAGLAFEEELAEFVEGFKEGELVGGGAEG
jgi:hypothetical protein